MMKNLKIRVKMFVIFGVLLICIVCAMNECVSRLGDVLNEITRFKTEAYDTNEKMWEMQNYMTITNNDLEKLVADEYNGDKKQIVTELEQVEVSIEERFLFIKSNLEDFDNELNTLNNHLNILKNKKNEIISYFQQGNIQTAKTKYEEYLTEYTIAESVAKVIFNGISEHSADLIAEANDTKNLALQRAKYSTIFIIVVCVLSGVLLSMQIKKPLEELKQVSKELAKGNLDVEIKYKSKDEMGQLAENMRETFAALRLYIKTTGDVLKKMSERDLTSEINVNFEGDFNDLKDSLNLILDSFNSMFQHIKASVEQTDEGADNIAKASEALAEATTEQSSVVEELVATVNEVDEHVNKNAESADIVKQLSARSAEKLMEGNQHIQQLLSSMEYMSKQSKEISNIIKIIEDISSSTNLLSLNASIEAARAGEAGKGFSVVANEIGKLANDCSIAAQNIAELISTTVEALAEAHKLTNETAVMMNEIVDDASESNSRVGEMALACNQQAESLDEILKGIQQISAVIEANSATAEETAAASQELLSQSDVLNSMLGEFHIKA